jgi:hypothetical protein
MLCLYSLNSLFFSRLDVIKNWEQVVFTSMLTTTWYWFFQALVNLIFSHLFKIIVFFSYPCILALCKHSYTHDFKLLILNVYPFLFNYWILFWIFACLGVLCYDIPLLERYVKFGWHMNNKHIWVFIFYFFQEIFILFQELCDIYFFNPI